MSRIIAGIYEIQQKIGAGGGGVVYLGMHLRLNKRVVLKADKRTLNTETEALRREVDMLKNLRHTYIPQVYDFVQEDGVVYTVMDYIEGESLDKLLARGQHLSQPQVIKWACQLLEALCYLHEQPPYGILHGDIKPANIMLRPDGNICLIDYNIALALGENGAVKVGFSRGYASPEHYGADYIQEHRAAAVGKASKRSLLGQAVSSSWSEEQETVTAKDLPEEQETVTIKSSDSEKERRTESGRSFEDGSTSARRGVMLDVRSDIYSLGATLYHLLSGKRPAQDAKEVEPLGSEICSPAVSKILQKAMEPDPALRYQSAQEMLWEFERLHTKDPRVLRHRRRMRIAAVVLVTAFLAGALSTFVGLKQLEQRQSALTLAEYSASALADGDVLGAVDYALKAIPNEGNIFEAPLTAQAQKALTDAVGVYDLSDGYKALDSLALPSEPFKLTVSPGGTKVAVIYAYEAAIFDLENRKRIVALPIQKSALSDAVFLDESRLVYAGDQGVTVWDLEKGMQLWAERPGTALTVSGDGSRIALVNRDDEYATIYRTDDGAVIAECSFSGLHLPVAANDIFADPEDDIFALNENGSMLAVSFSNGGLILFDLDNRDNDLIIYEESEYLHFEGGFSGKYFAFAAAAQDHSTFGLIDVEKTSYVGGYDARNRLVLCADETGIYLADGNLLVRILPDTMEEKELAYTDNANIIAFFVGDRYVMTATDDNCFSFFDSGANRLSTGQCQENCDFVALADRFAIAGSRNEPTLRLLILENHEDAQLLTYDAHYSHEEARISQDGQTAMLFGYQGFRIYSLEGELLAEQFLPDAEMIYDQQFLRTEEGSWLEVIWYDGMIRCYSAEDGRLIEEKNGEPPGKDLYEEFYTERYRIESSLHEPPRVYDLKTGKLVKELEREAYLTYVTQAGENIITEYISTSGERYGILLNRELEVLAYLPKLCDFVDGKAVFDYDTGDLRQCRLYSIQELIALGEAL